MQYIWERYRHGLSTYSKWLYTEYKILVKMDGNTEVVDVIIHRRVEYAKFQKILSPHQGSVLGSVCIPHFEFWGDSPHRVPPILINFTDQSPNWPSLRLCLKDHFGQFWAILGQNWSGNWQHYKWIMQLTYIDQKI